MAMVSQTCLKTLYPVCCCRVAKLGKVRLFHISVSLQGFQQLLQEDSQNWMRCLSLVVHRQQLWDDVCLRIFLWNTQSYSARTLGHEFMGCRIGGWRLISYMYRRNTYLHTGKRRSVRKQLTVNRVQLKWACFELMSHIVNTLTMATLISPGTLVYHLVIHVAKNFE